MDGLTPNLNQHQPSLEKRWFLATWMFLIPLTVMMVRYMLSIQMSKGLIDVIQGIALVTLPIALYEDVFMGYAIIKEHLAKPEPYVYVPMPRPTPEPKPAPVEPPAPPQPIHIKPVSKPFTRKGYVYVIKSLTDETFYKIGRSKELQRRLRKFEVKMPFEIEPICFIETNDMYALERELHLKYEAVRKEGEFFKLTDDDIQWIKDTYKESSAE